jgi:hypothetical protein
MARKKLDEALDRHERAILLIGVIFMFWIGHLTLCIKLTSIGAL